MKKIAALAMIIVFSLMAAGGSKKIEQFSNLSFTVLKGDTGMPVRNASVILHAVDEKGNQQNSGFQLKTDEEGAASVDSVPYGKLRVQVIAHGFQTYGEDYVIDQPSHRIIIKLKPPQRQYSIYDK
jgi:hypothetical protein